MVPEYPFATMSTDTSTHTTNSSTTNEPELPEPVPLYNIKFGFGTDASQKRGSSCEHFRFAPTLSTNPVKLRSILRHDIDRALPPPADKEPLGVTNPDASSFKDIKPPQRPAKKTVTVRATTRTSSNPPTSKQSSTMSEINQTTADVPTPGASPPEQPAPPLTQPEATAPPSAQPPPPTTPSTTRPPLQQPPRTTYIGYNRHPAMAQYYTPPPYWYCYPGASPGMGYPYPAWPQQSPWYSGTSHYLTNPPLQVPQVYTVEPAYIIPQQAAYYQPALQHTAPYHYYYHYYPGAPGYYRA